MLLTLALPLADTHLMQLSQNVGTLPRPWLLNLKLKYQILQIRRIVFVSLVWWLNLFIYLVY